MDEGHFAEMMDLSDEDTFKPKHFQKASPHKGLNSPVISLSCKLCKAKFTLRKNLLRHERRCGQTHKESNLKNVSLNCKSCKAKFTLRKNLLRHERNCIGEDLRRFMCSHCEKRFVSKPFLSSHIKKFHSESVSFNCTFCNAKFKRKRHCTRHKTNCSANPQVNLVRSQCSHCGSQFKRREDLDHHLKKCSLEKPNKPRKKVPCLIQNCGSNFVHKVDLIQHLSTSHQDKITLKPKQSLNFTSFDDFKVWKEKEEERTFSYFSARRGQKSRKILHYYCQHDGSSKAHSTRKTTRCNRKGQIKVGHYCIAKMKVNINDGKDVQVDYYPTHSHKCKRDDILHHPIPMEMSKYINEKLAENIPPDVVYDLTKDRFIQRNDQVHNTAASILTKKRVLERGRKRRKKRRLHEDDAKSVFLMAAKLIEKDDSVLIYKPLGQNVVRGPEDINNLPNSDDLFMFAFQTKEQLEVMKKHCSKIIIVDETHGTNQYKFKLLTAMVTDDDRHGWPVAHLITSKSDAGTLQFFFQAIRSRLDGPHPINCVITDDDLALINAMEAGFSQSLVHLLCIWHVIKNLKENLRSKVSSDLFEIMFDEMRAILNAKTEPLFLQLKKGFIRKYGENPGALKYLSYLDQHYWNRAKKWATCYRNFPHGGVNTTGHIESFHNRLKKFYLKRKVNKRLDDLINILYDVAWDDHCSRLRNASVGFSIQPKEIVERHKRGISMQDEVIIGKTLDGLWELKSEGSQNSYFIEQYKDSCDFDHCFSRCTKPECHGLCSHLFSCSCADLHPMCKHIHKLQSYLFKDLPFVPMEEEFYNFDAPNTFNEEVSDIAHDGVRDTVHDRKKQITLEKLRSHVSFLQQFLSRDIQEIPDHCIYQGEAVLSDYVQSLQVVEKLHPAGIETLPVMEPASVFTPNEKLKTQLSQLLPFKRPKKQQKEDISTRAAKRQAAIDGLLLEIQGDPIVTSSAA